MSIFGSEIAQVEGPSRPHRAVRPIQMSAQGELRELAQLTDSLVICDFLKGVPRPERRSKHGRL
jgi:hypothetical protein